MKVIVRMFRAGLGDCFLVTFDPDGAAVHVMIDCGVLFGTAGAAERIRGCVEDIHKLTGGRIDILVATHEHWDHVSGFWDAKVALAKLKIGRVWLAWTEDPNDELATRLRRERDERKQHLAAAVALWSNVVEAGALGGDPSSAATRLRVTQEVLAFGNPAGHPRAEALGVRGTTSGALDELRIGHRDKVQFLEPGTHHTLPGLRDVRAFVLGPPRDERLLRKGRPSKRNAETYSESGTGLTIATTVFAGVETAAAPEAPPVDSIAQPFDPTLAIDTRRVTRDTVPTQDSPEAFLLTTYLDIDSEWRRIDGDWLGVTSDLAIALDNDTNNTSLVLAFEVGDRGDVLLFPADAQVGSWLSWGSLAFDVGDGQNDRTVTSDELLARTTFYKVGHHASHNATLREHGLEKMTSPKLTAMIPVDGEMATRQRWAMPFGPLYARLLEKCQGRVLRLDEGLPDPHWVRRSAGSAGRPFSERVRLFPNYVELELE